MFDHYSQMTDLARKVAYQHPDGQTTWQDALRENRDSDLNFQSDSLSSESLLGSLALSLGTGFQRWQAKLLRRPAGLAGRHTHGLALGRRF